MNCKLDARSSTRCSCGLVRTDAKCCIPCRCGNHEDSIWLLDADGEWPPQSLPEVFFCIKQTVSYGLDKPNIGFVRRPFTCSCRPLVVTLHGTRTHRAGARLANASPRLARQRAVQSCGGLREQGAEARGPRGAGSAARRGALSC